MKIEQILTKRKWEHNYAYDLVYEWEDVFASTLQLPLVDEIELINNRYVKLIPLLSTALQTNKVSFEFEMESIGCHWFTNRKKNIIPFIIDYYPQEKGIYGYDMFNFLYKKHPAVFVSSAEVYEHLKSLGSRIKVNIYHVGLSLSDKYWLSPNTTFIKEYDLVLFGRQSPVLMNYLEEYKRSHQDFLYVYNKRINGQLLYYTSDGELLDDINTREKYISLMKKAKCAFYTTPGIDSEKVTYGFNQITPRFLELIAAGCHIIARYANNADAHFYEVDSFCESINNYSQFEEALDFARKNEVDIPKYAAYLEKHYTSVRAKQVEKILSEI